VSDHIREEARAARTCLVLAAALVMPAAIGCAHGGQPGSGPPAALRAEGDWTVVDGIRLQRQRARVDCGPRALAMVLERWGVDPAPALAIDPGRTGASAATLRERTRALGLAAFVFKGTLDDLGYEIDHARPVVLGVVRQHGRYALTHYVVLVGHDQRRQRWLLADPGEGWTVVTSADLTKQWAPGGQVMMAVFPRAGAPGEPVAPPVDRPPVDQSADRAS